MSQSIIDDLADVPTLEHEGVAITGNKVAACEYQSMERMVEEMDEEPEDDSDPGLHEVLSQLPTIKVVESVHYVKKCKYINKDAPSC